MTLVLGDRDPEPRRREVSVRHPPARSCVLAGWNRSQPTLFPLSWLILGSFLLHVSVTLYTELDLPHTLRELRTARSAPVGPQTEQPASWRLRLGAMAGRETSLWPSVHTLAPHSRIVKGAGVLHCLQAWVCGISRKLMQRNRGATGPMLTVSTLLQRLLRNPVGGLPANGVGQDGGAREHFRSPGAFLIVSLGVLNPYIYHTFVVTFLWGPHSG